MKYKGIRTNIDFEIRSPVLKNLIIVFLCLLLLFFIVYPIVVFNGTDNKLRTQTAITRTVYRTVDTEAFVIREETVIKNSFPGTIVPAVKNGNKVAIGDTVANIYADDMSAENAARLQELQAEINYYLSISVNTGNSFQTDIEIYKNGVTESLFSISSATENNELSDIYSLSRDFREAVTKKQMAMGQRPDVSLILDGLTAEYDSLKNSVSVKSTITAEQAGYFVSTADGYEDIVDFSTVKELRAEDVNEIFEAVPAVVSSDTVGKLITDFNWYLVFNAERSVLGDIATGSDVVITFMNSSVGELKMTVKSINQTEGSSDVTVILYSNMMNEDIAALRNVSIKLRVDSYTGLVVDRQALRTVDSVAGVYIKVGNIVKFKKINIIYSDENVILSAIDNSAYGYLELYDEIILEGTELYDSKLLT